MRCRPDARQLLILVEAAGGADVRVENLTWRPLRRRTPVLDRLDLLVPAGERVLLAGPSGAGKSTLLRALAGVLLTASAGDLTGQVTVGAESGCPVGRAGSVGFLQQEPLSGVVAETAGRDVAFGLENRHVPRAKIWPRVHEALSAVGFPYGPQHPVSRLSGGEMQRVMLAGAIVQQAPVLLLDEPTSMLDPASAESLRDLLQATVSTTGCTAVIVDHDPGPWLDFVDRLVVLGRDGQLVADGPPFRILAEHSRALEDSGMWLPGAGPPPLADLDPVLLSPYVEPPEEVVRADSVDVDLTHRRGYRTASSRRALDGVSAALRTGRVLAITGRSGAGKSTLTSVLAGLQRPTGGTVRVAPELRSRRGDEPWRWTSRDLASRLAWSPQFPEHGVVSTTVLDEVLATARACNRPAPAARSRATALLEFLSLSALTDVSPYHLSGGEQRRLMVAAALTHGPAGALFDEPTVGQDRRTWATVLGALRAARDGGSAVGLSTHDGQAVTALNAVPLRLDQGRVVA